MAQKVAINNYALQFDVLSRSDKNTLRSNILQMTECVRLMFPSSPVMVPLPMYAAAAATGVADTAATPTVAVAVLAVLHYSMLTGIF